MTDFPRFDLTAKVALITACARGIGRATALALANAGADVALGLREKSSDGGLGDEIAAMGRRVLPLQMDVTNLQQIESAVAEAHKHFGRIDILVNNAGIGPENAAEKVTEADFDATLAVNLKGTFFVSQAVGRIMIAQGGGRIVNMSSQAGQIALNTESVYCMSKAGVDHLTRCLAVEWGKYNINVNAVSPTFIRTDGTAPALSDPAFKAHVLDMIKLGRVGEPVDVAGAVIFLAGPAAGMITGSVLLVDGGWTAH